MSSITLGNVSIGLRTNADDLDRMDILPQLAHHLRNAADAIDAHIAGIGEPVAYCCPDDPFNSTAFSCPGTERVLSRHTMPLYTTPPIDLAAVRDVIAELRQAAWNPECALHQFCSVKADELEAAIKGGA